TGTLPFGRSRSAAPEDGLELPSRRRPDLGLSRIDAVVARAMAPRPADRYVAAIELAADLACLRRGAPPRHAREPPSEVDPPIALGAGRVVGRYRLSYPVGRGGSAVVWKATAEDGSVVALKVVRALDAESVARVGREVRLLALLAAEEKGFVPLLDQGVC